ncbi:hypothetical protein [Variovorax soli]|uniref:hypothetical protein n=1 Tax=Variovorax soli TaxID=376815 RepID=UPI0008392FA5
MTAQTFTATDAINHPAIRVAILAGQKVAEATGNRPEPAALIKLVNAALPVVAMIEEAHRPQGTEDDPEGAGWTERVLVAMLSGALVAAGDHPGQLNPPGTSARRAARAH